MVAAAGGMPPLNVNIRITTSGAKAAASAMSSVTGASKKMSRGLGAGIISARTLGDSMRQAASMMKYTIAGGFMNIGKAALQASRNFELSFSRIRGLTGLAADSVEKMKKGVLDMAVSTTRGPEELAEALYFVTSSGIRDTTIAMDILNKSARASAAGLGETKVVADAVTSAMNAYGSANLSAGKATDVLVAAVREGKAEADTFAPAFSKVLPVSAAFGASFEDVSAAMAALTRSGMTAGTAGIYVRQVLSNLLKPSKQAQDALAGIGTTAGEIRTEVQEKGLFTALTNLSTKLGGTDEGAEKFAKVFGNVRALTAMLQLVGPAAGENGEIFERLSNTTGDLDHAFQAYSETIDAKFQRNLAASRVALIEIGDAIKPVIGSLLSLSTEFMKLGKVILDNPIASGFLKGFASIVLVIAAVASLMKTFSALIRLGQTLTLVLTGNQLMYNANTKALMRMVPASSAAAASAGALTTAHGVYIPITGAATVATHAFRGALTALSKHPYMLAFLAIVTALAGVVTLFKKASKSADETRNSISKVTDILDETVKYGKTTFSVDVEIDVKDKQAEQQIDRVKEQIEEQSPQLLPNVTKVFSEQGEEAGLAFINNMMNSIFGGGSDEQKAALLAMFADLTGYSQEAIKGAAAPSKVTGDFVTDSLIEMATTSAANATEGVRAAMNAVLAVNPDEAGIKTYIKVMENMQNPQLPEYDYQGAKKSLDRFGNEIVDAVDATGGDLRPLIATMLEFEEAGQFNESNIRNLFGDSLEELKGDLNIAKEESADFFDIIMHDDNRDALGRMFQTTMGGAGDINKAFTLFDKVKAEVEALPAASRNSVGALGVLVKALNPYLALQEDALDLNSDVAQSFDIIRQQVQDATEEYTNQTNVMKTLKDAQRALIGIRLDENQALRASVESMRELQDLEGAGKFDLSSDGIANTEDLEQAAFDVQEYANAVYAATGDADLAGLRFGQGLTGIIENITKGGGDATAALDFLTNMGFTPENFAASLISAQEGADKQSVDTGAQVMNGIARGVAGNTGGIESALVTALNNVIITARTNLQIKSPSRKTADLIGVPMAMGIGEGFRKEMKTQSGGMAKDLQTAVTKLYTGKYDQKKAQKFFADFLKSKKAVETPAQDFVKETIGRMKDIIGSLGSYIKSQLSFRDAQSNLAKLINMQRKYDDDRKKSARQVQYNETRRGGMGGAQVTGYEQSEIDELQIAFEKTSRDYAMGRATYTALFDAEIALFEARAAASEIDESVIGTQNDFIDASVKVENKNLELAGATVEVLEAYQDVQEAAYELYINHKELEGVYKSLAEATGIANGQLQIGNTNLATIGTTVGTFGGYATTVGGFVSTLGNSVGITKTAFDTNFYGATGVFGTITKTGSDVHLLTKGIGANFTELSRGMLDPDSEMMKNLKSLGPAIFNAIQTAANEQFAKSPLHLKIPVNVTVSTSGGGGASKNDPDNSYTDPNSKATGAASTPGFYKAKGGGSTDIFGRSTLYKGKAVGGPVTGMRPYMVGEMGPEMFIPKVSGTIITNNALDRYTRTRQTKTADSSQGTANNIVVTVNNPVPQAAEESITRRMKVLTNSGLFG